MSNEPISSVASLGGIARAEKLSPDERSKIAQVAAQARWAKNDMYKDFVFPLKGGEIAKLTIPFPMDEEDFEFLAGQLRSWKERLVSNK